MKTGPAITRNCPAELERLILMPETMQKFQPCFSRKKCSSCHGRDATRSHL
jgi:hypothetical protein